MELEVEPELWSNAPDRFRARIREAYEECARAVQDELDRRAPSPPERDSQTNQSGTERPVRLSTQAQARALRTIAKRLDLDVDELICSRFEVNSIELLSRVQASNLIDELQAKTLGEPA